MAWIAPKLDWSPSDSINAIDFNRIENNTAEVAAYLNGIQYTIPSLIVIKNRDKTYIDFLSSINRIEQNLEAIRTHFLTPTDYPGAKAWTVGNGFGYNDAIRLETNIKMLMDFGLLVFDSLVYCGTINAGYERGDLSGIL